jgi:hypothetical protein
MIAGTLAHLRLERAWDPERVEFTDDDLDDLWQRWLRPFTGTGEGDGWLDQLDPAGLALARDRLPSGFPRRSPLSAGSLSNPAAATANAWSQSNPSLPLPSFMTWSSQPT